MIATFIKSFRYGSSVRTLYQLSAPLSDRIPLRHFMLRIQRDDGITWLAAYSTGKVMCFCAPCADDMAKIEAAVSVAHTLVE